MAQKTIPELQEETDFGGNALIVIDTGTQTYKITSQNFADALLALLTPLDGDAVLADGSVTPDKLSIPYALEGYSFTGAAPTGVVKDVSSQTGTPQGFAFNDDGTVLYVIGAADTIWQYDLSTPYDVSTAVFDASVTLTSESGYTSPTALFFKPDGTQVFVLYDHPSAPGDEVHPFTLSTPWDITTATYDSVNFNVNSQSSTSYGIALNDDGTKMYIYGNGGNIYQYTFSTAYDVTTLSYDSVSLNASAQDNAPGGMFFNSDGTLLFLIGNQNDRVYKYSLSTGFDLSTATYTGDFLDISSSDSTPTGVWFNSNGTKMLMVGIGSDTITEYSTGAIVPA